MAEVTHDALLGGRVALAQPARGYRVNVDAVLLAAFAARTLGTAEPPKPRRRARLLVDLGAGVGGVAFCALALGAAERAVLVELEEGYGGLARENVRANGLEGRAEVVVADVLVAAKRLAGKADLVVTNPPYVPPGRGRLPAAERAGARSGSLDTFLDAARAALGPRGRACLVYPAIELTTLLGALRARRLEPKRLAMVQAKPSSPARVVLVEAVAGKPGGLVVAPPVVETSAEVRRVVRGA